MILKALYDYYESKKNEMPSYNMALVNFMYAIQIDRDGNFKGIECLGDDEGISLLTFRPEERTSAPIAHCMGDNGSYVLGLKDVSREIPVDLEKELKKNIKNHEAFKEDVQKIYVSLPNNQYAQAVYAFYQKYDINVIHQMCKDVNWLSLCKSLNKNITFRILGEKSLAASDSEIIDYKISIAVNRNDDAICLVTGNRTKPVTTTYSTFVVGGKSNAKLVAFQINSGYDSYGRKMGLNAPISTDAEFKYTTALLSMLSKNSRNKFIVGNRTFVFWASKNNEAGKQVEEGIWKLFGFNDTNEDDPNKGITQVRRVFESIYTGSLKTSPDDKFYILGLAPNSARIAVTYWAEIPLVEFAGRINRHFKDMEIIDGRKEQKPYSGLRSVLSAVTLDGKVSEVIPNLPEAVVKCIFQGLLYPQPLYASCIRRIRAEQNLTITRAAVIKAYLNRLNNSEQKIKVMLDKENTNQGYLCGRLFAVLDKIQGDANGQHSIKERYMNAASSTPAAVFATILNLSSHHSEKLKEGRDIFFERIKQEIMDKIEADGFPAHLDLQDQGRFFVGYYHQMQSFYVKNEVQSEIDN